MKQIIIDIAPDGIAKVEASNTVVGASCETVVKTISDLIAEETISSEVKPQYYEQEVDTDINVSH
jgi:hypothetical protein